MKMPVSGGQSVGKDTARVVEGRLMIRIDGERTDLTSLNDVPTGNIKQVNVTKGKARLTEMGLGDYDALIDISTKEEVSSEEDSPVTIRINKDNERKNIAYFLDGERYYPQQGKLDINPASISKIDVVKGESLIALGLEAFEGAVYITTNKGVKEDRSLRKRKNEK